MSTVRFPSIFRIPETPYFTLCTLLWRSFEFEKAEKVSFCCPSRVLAFFFGGILNFGRVQPCVCCVKQVKNLNMKTSHFLINRWSFPHALPRTSSVNPRAFCFYHGEERLQQIHTLITQCWQCCIQMDAAGSKPCVFRKFYASETRDAQVDGSLNYLLSNYCASYVLAFNWHDQPLLTSLPTLF